MIEGANIYFVVRKWSELSTTRGKNPYWHGEAQHLLHMLQASWAEQHVSLFVGHGRGHGLTRSVGVA